MTNLHPTVFVVDDDASVRKRLAPVGVGGVSCRTF